MHLRYGPCQDSPSFVPAVTQAARHLPIDRLFADGAYDVEAHHRYSREQLGIRSTIIPINPRRPHQQEPKTKYRAQLHRRFPRRLYGSRWHVEAAISQHKRKLGSALSATSEPGRESECILRHIVHNLMILLLSTRKGFYRAFIEQWHTITSRVYPQKNARPFGRASFYFYICLTVTALPIDGRLTSDRGRDRHHRRRHDRRDHHRSRRHRRRCDVPSAWLR